MRKPRSVHLEIPGDIYAAFSPNRYLSGWERGRRTKAWRERAWGYWYRAGAVVLAPPVRLEVIVIRGSTVDEDNLIASCKSLIDSLTPKRKGPMQQSCLPNDSRKTITERRYECVSDIKWKGLEQVIINVEEVSADD